MKLDYVPIRPKSNVLYQGYFITDENIERVAETLNGKYYPTGYFFSGIPEIVYRNNCDETYAQVGEWIIVSSEDVIFTLTEKEFNDTYEIY